MLTPLNPIAQPATILPNGNPGALQVALARNKQEDDLAKDGLAAKAAAAGEADKQKAVNKGEAAKRMAELGKETVFRHYGIEWKGMFNNYVDEYAKASQLHAQDPTKYSDPDDPGTEAGSYFFKRQMDLHQAKKSSDDIQTQYEADMAYYKANESKFRPGALQALEAKYADPTKWKNGEIIDKPLELWDLEGNVKATFGAMKDEIIASAGPTSDGGAYTYSLERPVSGALKGLAQTFAADAWADGSLQERYAALSQPARERINALAEANKMSPGEALALDMATNLYGATKTTRTYNAPSESGSGAAADKRGSLWLGKLIEGYMDKSYQLEKGQGGTKLVSPAKDAAGLFGKTEDVFRDPTTLVGWKWDTKNVFNGKQQIKLEKDIKDFQVDYDRQVFTVKIGDAGSKDVTEVEVIPFDQAESKLVPRLGGLNKENIRAIGGYDAAAEVTGEGTRKGAGAGNIVNTPQTSVSSKWGAKVVEKKYN